MTNEYVLIAMPLARQRLAEATRPEESRDIEKWAKAAIGYFSQEREDYANMVNAVKIYYEARRKTTELILPHIQHGGNTHVTLLSDFNITKMQWNRRVKELNIAQDVLDNYFDECISNGWNPSIAGLLQSSGNGGEPQSNATKLYNLAVKMLQAGEYKNENQRVALLSITDIFKD